MIMWIALGKKSGGQSLVAEPVARHRDDPCLDHLLFGRGERLARQARPLELGLEGLARRRDVAQHLVGVELAVEADPAITTFDPHHLALQPEVLAREEGGYALARQPVALDQRALPGEVAKLHRR